MSADLQRVQIKVLRCHLDGLHIMTGLHQPVKIVHSSGLKGFTSSTCVCLYLACGACRSGDGLYSPVSYIIYKCKRLTGMGTWE